MAVLRLPFRPFSRLALALAAVALLSSCNGKDHAAKAPAAVPSAPAASTPASPASPSSARPPAARAEPRAACPAFHPDGRAPRLTNPKLQASTRDLCFEAFAVLHSGVSRTPLWVAERLTRASVADARDEVRTDRFYAEPRLPPGERAELSDYRGSGLDRGHMAPAADMPTATAMAESFSLANMVPQARQNNRGIWADIERLARQQAGRRGTIYVVSGPVFSGTRLERAGRVLVPTHLFKVLHDPATGESWAYIVPNTDDAVHRTVPLEEVETLAGLQLFPGQARRFPDRPPQPSPSAQRRGNRN